MSYKSTILITGGTQGLGLEAAAQIAKRCPDQQIIIASRSSNDALKYTKAENVKFIPLDLSDPSKVREFAKQVQSFPPISALLLNAALQFPGEVGYYASGIERTFAITHVGNSLLFHLLVPRFTEDARIVVTASGVHFTPEEENTGMPTPIFTTAAEVARPDPQTATKDGRTWYTTAKLANILWMYALDRRIKQQGKSWTVNSFDPGLMPGSGLAREYSPFLRFLWFNVLPYILPLVRILIQNNNVHTTAESGTALTRLAVDQDVKNKSGVYFEGLKERASSKDSRNEAKQEDLWNWTVAEIAKDTAEKEKFQKLA